jgi:hypothetical protein
MMITTTIIEMEYVWNNLQEPCGTATLPESSMRLLAALDQGWKVVKIELTPSWDQYGFIYVVTLKHPSRKHSRLLILPKNYTVDHLIHSFTLPTELCQDYQPECASWHTAIRSNCQQPFVFRNR